MAFERHWAAIAPRSFVSDGTLFGLITLNQTADFRIKQIVTLEANTLNPLSLQVKQVLSPTQLVVGPIDQKIPGTPTDIRAFTVALGATIRAEKQNKNNVPEKDHYSAIYEGDPVNADRVIITDNDGDFYTSSNPVPVNVVNAAGSVPSDPFIANVNVNTANTEFSFTFPDKTVKFLMRVRDGMAKTQFSWTLGQSNSLFMTMPMGTNYREELDVSNKTIYFQLNKANKVVEFLYWVQP